jgi:hypothetical protein
MVQSPLSASSNVNVRDFVYNMSSLQQTRRLATSESFSVADLTTPMIVPWTAAHAPTARFLVDELFPDNVTVEVSSESSLLGSMYSVISNPDGIEVRVVGSALTQEVLQSGVLELGAGVGLSGNMSSGGSLAPSIPLNVSEAGADPMAFHAAAGVTDAIFHPSLLSSPLYAGEKVLGWKDVHGGHHDAGDYGTYTYPLTYTLQTLLTAYDIAPTKVSLGRRCVVLPRSVPR